MNEEKKTFWSWASDNPITVVVMFLVILGGVALVLGYKEGFMGILGGLLNWIRGGDAENKHKLEEAKKNTNNHFANLGNMVNNIKEQQITNDREVEDSVTCAKAECDDMDVDELIDIGNSMLRDHSAFRSQEN